MQVQPLLLPVAARGLARRSEQMINQMECISFKLFVLERLWKGNQESVDHVFFVILVVAAVVLVGYALPDARSLGYEEPWSKGRQRRYIAGSQEGESQ